MWTKVAKVVAFFFLVVFAVVFFFPPCKELKIVFFNEAI